ISLSLSPPPSLSLPLSVPLSLILISNYRFHFFPKNLLRLMILFVFLLSSAIQSSDSCAPTSHTPMPGPTPCPLCAKSLLSATAFDPDVIDISSGGCYERTLTCKKAAGASSSYITLNNDPTNVITDGGTGTATLVVDCDDGGGTKITQAVCSQS
ncbi:hypothetical protein PENTCL1PPCAC_14720, partial [Pristionchus entomophagus]